MNKYIVCQLRKDNSALQVDLNLSNGYSINLLSGDSILFFINDDGDTIHTGSPVLLEGTQVFNYTEPQKRKYSPIDSYNSSSNEKEVGKLKKFYFELKDLKKTPSLSAHDKFVFKDDNGKEILSNSYIEAEGVVIPSISKKPSKALSLKFKDAAKRNLQYIDVDEGLNSSYVILEE